MAYHEISVKDDNKQHRKGIFDIFYVLPAIITLGLISIYPIIYSVFMSFFNWDWGNRMDFVGFDNYIMYISDPNFFRVVAQTLYFTIGAVLIEVILGFIIAIVINNLSFGLGFFRTIMMVPIMFSGIIVALMSKMLLDPTLGVVNYLLNVVGLPTSVWFGNATTAMPSIILVDTWWRTPFVFIIISAALRSLPVEPYEAAEMDGANRVQKFRFLTLPMLKPVLIIVILLRTIDCLKVFEIVYGATGGGPNQVTEVIQTLAYRTGFKFQQMSRSMTIMVIFSIIFILIILIYIRLSNRTRRDL